MKLRTSEIVKPNFFKEIGSLKVVPPYAVLEYCEIDDYTNVLFEEEYRTIRAAVPKRKHEFSTGRLCARRALCEFGIESSPILVGRMREPIWPKGYCGSITHDGSYAIAAVSKQEYVSDLGIDLAVHEPLGEELIRFVCSGEEINCGKQFKSRGGKNDPFKTIFSIKEALYKCLYKRLGRIFDFRDVEVFLERDTNSAKILLRRSDLFSNLDLSLIAKYHFCPEYIFSCVWVEAG